jgi:hypothetical protein
MDKFEVIKNFLLDESVSPEIRRERFEIAWDIKNHFDEITKILRQKVFETVLDKLKKIEDFKSYKKSDLGFLKGDKWGSFILYKDEWTINGNPIVSYAIEMENIKNKNFSGLYYGIKKQNDKNPFNGKWHSAELSNGLKNILYTLQSILNNWKVGEWWIFWKYFEGFYAVKNPQDEYKFYMELILSSNLQEGINSVANYYVKKIVELKNLTEKQLDEFVKLLKSTKSENLNL